MSRFSGVYKLLLVDGSGHWNLVGCFWEKCLLWVGNWLEENWVNIYKMSRGVSFEYKVIWGRGVFGL
jgi:hypothetical protein